MKQFYIVDEQGNRYGTVNWDYQFDKPIKPVEPPKSGKKIALVIGHDSDEQGAYGNMGLSEFRFNNELLREISDTLPKQHEYGLFYRSADINGYSAQMVDLHERLDQWGADISIEFHFNSFHDPSANGNEVLYCSNAGMEIAEKLDKAFDEYLDNRDRGIKKVAMKDRGGQFCCRGKSIAIISEPFFGANQNRFVQGGDQREPLKKALIQFLNSLG